MGQRHLADAEPARSRLRWAAALGMALALVFLLASLYLQRQRRAGSRDRAATGWLIAPVSAAPPDPSLLRLESPAPPEAPAAPPAPVGDQRTERIRVQPSDTLRRIALRRYGRWDPQIWEHIREHNPGLLRPDKLKAGQELLLTPLRDAEGAAP